MASLASKYRDGCAHCGQPGGETVLCEGCEDEVLVEEPHTWEWEDEWNTCGCKVHPQCMRFKTCCDHPAGSHGSCEECADPRIKSAPCVLCHKDHPIPKVAVYYGASFTTELLGCTVRDLHRLNTMRPSDAPEAYKALYENPKATFERPLETFSTLAEAPFCIHFEEGLKDDPSITMLWAVPTVVHTFCATSIFQITPYAAEDWRFALGPKIVQHVRPDAPTVGFARAGKPGQFAAAASLPCKICGGTQGLTTFCLKFMLTGSCGICCQQPGQAMTRHAVHASCAGMHPDWARVHTSRKNGCGVACRDAEWLLGLYDAAMRPKALPPGQRGVNTMIDLLHVEAAEVEAPEAQGVQGGDEEAADGEAAQGVQGGEAADGDEEADDEAAGDEEAQEAQGVQGGDEEAADGEADGDEEADDEAANAVAPEEELQDWSVQEKIIAVIKLNKKRRVKKKGGYYMLSDTIVEVLERLGVADPRPRLQEACIGESNWFVHNGCAANDAAICLTDEAQRFWEEVLLPKIYDVNELRKALRHQSAIAPAAPSPVVPPPADRAASLALPGQNGITLYCVKQLGTYYKDCLVRLYVFIEDGDTFKDMMKRSCQIERLDLPAKADCEALHEVYKSVNQAGEALRRLDTTTRSVDINMRECCALKARNGDYILVGRFDKSLNVAMVVNSPDVSAFTDLKAAAPKALSAPPKAKAAAPKAASVPPKAKAAAPKALSAPPKARQRRQGSVGASHGGPRHCRRHQGQGGGAQARRPARERPASKKQKISDVLATLTEAEQRQLVDEVLLRRKKQKKTASARVDPEAPKASASKFEYGTKRQGPTGDYWSVVQHPKGYAVWERVV